MAHARLGRVWVAQEAAQVRGLVRVGGFGWTVAKRDQYSVQGSVRPAGAVWVEEFTMGRPLLRRCSGGETAVRNGRRASAQHVRV